MNGLTIADLARLFEFYGNHQQQNPDMPGRATAGANLNLGNIGQLFGEAHTAPQYTPQSRQQIMPALREDYGARFGFRRQF